MPTLNIDFFPRSHLSPDGFTMTFTSDSRLTFENTLHT